MDLDRDNALIGLLVLTCVGVFTGLAFHRSMTRLVKVEVPYQVSLDRAGDLAPGTPVLLQGVQVGQVKGVNLQRQGVTYRIQANLGLRPDITLWEGTRAEVVSRALGGASLALVLGPAAERRTVLAPGSTLPGDVAPGLADAVGEIQALARNANAGLEALRRSLSARGAGVVLDHPALRQVLGQLDTTLQEAGTLARSGQGLAAEAQPALASLARVLASLEGPAATLDRRQGDLDQAVASLARALTELEGLSRDLRARLGSTGPEAEATLQSLQRTLQSADTLLRLLQAKPSRLLYGRPTGKELEAARPAAPTGSSDKPTK